MRRRSLSWPLVIGVLGAAAVVAVVTVPAAAPVRGFLREAPRRIGELPERSEEWLREARERLALAKQTFQSARAESERALILQLREAKERGSLPPV